MGHAHGHAAGRAEDRRRLRLVLLVTAVVLALGASYVASLRGGPRSTFGLHRAEVLAALVNAVLLLGVCGYLLYAGVTRLADPVELDAAPMLAFAAVGL